MDELWRLAHPWVLAAGAAALALVWWARRGRVEHVAGGAVAHRHGDVLAWLVDALPGVMVAAALLTGLVAWANPQHGTRERNQKRHGVAILNVLDTSDSMLALDFASDREKLTRMDGAKRVLKRFVDNRPHDQHGLVVFGSKVVTLVPLTADRNLVLDAVDQVDVRVAGGATALGDAIALGVKRLAEVPFESKVMILLSDGKKTAGDVEPLEAAAFAAERGVRIYTIGIGRDGAAPFRVKSLFGTTIQRRKVEMDKATLREAAAKTGGRYFHATDVEQLGEVYDRIDRMEKTTFEARERVSYESRYFGYLAACLGLALVSLVWQAVGQRRFPLQ